MFFFQLPHVLPVVKQSGSAKGKDKVGSSSSSMGIGASSKRSKLEELPEGYMGKMLVYKKGAIRLKLGDITYDVSFSIVYFKQTIAENICTCTHTYVMFMSLE